MKCTCIVPVYNEASNVEPLTMEIISVCDSLRVSYEILFVNDGSTDNTQSVLHDIQKKYPNIISIIEFRTNYGKSAVYDAGFQLAKGDVIVTLDGDGQDDPNEIPALLSKLKEGYDVVSGWKQNRKDGFIKNSTSVIFNNITGIFSKVKLHDFNCGLKAYTREAALTLRVYGELYRFIPVILSSHGFRVAEIPIAHRKRFSGKSKYGSLRFINGFLDLITVISLTQFRNRPFHFFGYIGTIFFSIGFIGAIYLTCIKFIYHVAIGNRPLLLFAVMLMIMGFQVGISGLIGEYVIISVPKRKQEYDIKSLRPHTYASK
jgi:glycosyltransferase involved in cell wall biosynthesis